MTTQTQTTPAAKPNNGAKAPAPVATAPASATAPAAAKNNTQDDDKDDGSDEGETKTRQSRKVYIVTGETKEFKNAAEAEKFLNSDGAPRDFTVIKGLKVEKKQKVSLR